MDSRKASARRAASAGYRFPDPAAAAAAALTSHSSGPPFRQPAAKVRLGRTGEAPTRDPDFRDPVKQDQVWREFVRAERDGAKEWQKNWSFLRNYDQLVRYCYSSPLRSVPPIARLFQTITHTFFLRSPLSQSLYNNHNCLHMRGNLPACFTGS
uniref:Ciliary microtubule inner protein 5 n=1 Tax=Paramormyrops kingsleyae TaxID=1676925 RepID=A0A3B3R206_9TELE